MNLMIIYEPIFLLDLASREPVSRIEENEVVEDVLRAANNFGYELELEFDLYLF